MVKYLIIGLFGAAACVWGLHAVPADSLPQRAQGDGVVSVIFGDARNTISLAMFQKADSYFHGGVDMDCDCDFQRSADVRSDQHAIVAAFDPWKWMNSRIRAPEVEKHLQGEKAVEMLPWFWASVKTDPHNVDAWSTAWYVAMIIIKDKVLATRIVDEGKRLNPDSLELALCAGRTIYDSGRGDSAAALAAFVSAREHAMKKCEGEVSRLSESDAHTLRYIDGYITKLRAVSD